MCCAFIEGKQLHLLNIGDMRAIMIDSLGKSRQLTTDHTLSNIQELKRVKKVGAHIVQRKLVFDWRQQLFNPQTQEFTPLTRAIGNYQHRDQGLINHPDYLSYQVEPHDLVLAIVTESIYQRISKEKLTNIVLNDLKSKGEHTANIVIAEAVNRRLKITAKHDDMSVLLVYLDQSKLLI